MDGPWYMPVPEAAKVAGISERQLRDYIRSLDPPPLLKAGKNKVLVPLDGLREYLKSKEI